jgi:hypothetical protein
LFHSHELQPQNWDLLFGGHFSTFVDRGSIGLHGAIAKHHKQRVQGLLGCSVLVKEILSRPPIVFLKASTILSCTNRLIPAWHLAIFSAHIQYLLTSLNCTICQKMLHFPRYYSHNVYS